MTIDNQTKMRVKIKPIYGSICCQLFFCYKKTQHSQSLSLRPCTHKASLQINIKADYHSPILCNTNTFIYLCNNRCILICKAEQNPLNYNYYTFYRYTNNLDHYHAIKQFFMNVILGVHYMQLELWRGFLLLFSYLNSLLCGICSFFCVSIPEYNIESSLFSFIK